MRRAMTLAATCGALLFAGCANSGGGSAASSREGEAEVRRGVVTRIDPVTLEHHHQTGLGAVLGAAAGGVVGNRFGKGGGRDVATVLGVLGGGLIGNQVEGRYAEKRDGQHVFVELGNGVVVAVTQPADPTLREGDKVFVEGRGNDARVVRR